MGSVKVETAFLANHAEWHDGLLFISGGFPEWWNTPAWGQLQQMAIVVVSRLEAAELDVQYDLELVFCREDGTEQPLLRVTTRRVAREGEPVLPIYYGSIVFNFATDFRKEGLHHFLVRQDGNTLFDVPVYARLVPLPPLPGIS